MKQEQNHSVKRLVTASMLAALVCIATMIIKIPSPLHGYINLGDCFVLLCGWLLSPGYAFLSAGIGSGLADFFSGYLTYVPATFLIKGIMAVFSYYSFHFLHEKLGEQPSRILGGIGAEIIMILGYYIFEGFLYGFGPSVVNIPANGIQGAAGCILSVLLINILKKVIK